MRLSRLLRAVTLSFVTTVSAVGLSTAAAASGPPPVVTAVSTSSGPSTGGTSVALTGSGLSGATRVLFGAIPATTMVVNTAESSITAAAPSGTGPVDSTVSTPNGTSAAVAADQFT